MILYGCPATSTVSLSIPLLVRLRYEQNLKEKIINTDYVNKIDFA